LRAILKSYVMNYFDISAEPRKDLGKKATKAVRAAKRIPACIYGEANVEFSTTAADIRHLIYSPDFKVVRVDLEGKSYNCIVKDVQFHPTSDEIVHIDFQQLLDDRPIKVEIPIFLKGASTGVKAGGKMLQVLRRLKVKTLPKNLVDRLEIDVTPLDLGQAMRVKEVSIPEGIEVLVAPSIPVCQVEIPRALRSAAAAKDKEAGSKK
jgi:large subunit ribosomal protein L25